MKMRANIDLGRSNLRMSDQIGLSSTSQIFYVVVDLFAMDFKNKVHFVGINKSHTNAPTTCTFVCNTLGTLSLAVTML